VNRYFMIIAANALAAACVLQAQTANPLSTEAKQAYTSVKNNLLKAAEKMPEEGYAFKATPEVRTFGQLIAHIADSQTRTCTAVNGEQKSGSAGSKTAKADLVAALKASFADCDSAYDALTDATATDMIKTARGQRSRLGTLVGNTIHDNEEYGYLAVYMRLKGVVPPSSEGR
jgi:DinB superfamily